MDIQFTPGYFFIGMCTGIRSIGSSGIAYLAEITPERNFMHLQVLVHHGHYANRKITCYSPADLEETNSFSAGIVLIKIRKPYHVLNSTLHGIGAYLAFDHIRGEDISHGTVFPASHYNW